MRSKHADIFNHDLDAPRYDANVLNERDPIRTGYEDVLNWVIESAKISSKSSVLDLGSGTANLCARIKACKELVCVDISREMTKIARTKLQQLPNVTFVIADLLEFFDQNRKQFDVIISTYTIHHLVEDEKQLLFKRVWQALKPGGCAVFGDLMLESETLEPVFVKKYEQQEMRGVAEAIKEEFFWHVDTAVQGLRKLGFETEVQRFSDLSWGISAIKHE